MDGTTDAAVATTILAGVALFTAVVLVLTAALMLARALLVPRGGVRLVVNGDTAHALQVDAGGSLLQRLADRGVLVPAGCGGKGTCGLCRVTVRGGGAPTPAERALLTHAERRAGRRLACQVRVHHGLEVEVPAQAFGARRRTLRVAANRSVGTFIKELTLALPAGEPMDFRAGAYVQIECPPHELDFRDIEIDERFRDAWDRDRLWRFRSIVKDPVERAYSMANPPHERGVLKFTVRICFPPPGQEELPPGVLSSWIFALKPGDPVTVSGPFGEFHVREGDGEICFVGGGAGMGPMRSMILDQLQRVGTTRPITFWYGARSRREAFYVDEFDALARAHPNFRWQLALSSPRPEDRWDGPIGPIHEVLRDRYLRDHPEPEAIRYHMCGPANMSRAVIAMLTELGVESHDILFDNFSGE